MNNEHMKQKLGNKSDAKAFREIIEKFGLGEPLSADQVNFLLRYEHLLSHPEFDSILKYYLKIIKIRAQKHGFELEHTALNKEAINQLKERIKLLLEQRKGISHYVEVLMNIKQLEQLKCLAHQELIFYHGNQFLTDAPFHPGGIPYTILFQWGNLFGIIKYVIMAGEHGNILLHFEEKNHRLFEAFIKEYEKEHKQELRLMAMKPLHTMTNVIATKHIIPKEIPAEHDEDTHLIPKPSLNPFKNNDDKKKE